MSIGRSPPFTNASIRILIATLLIGFLPGVSASCWIDSRTGVEYCDGLSPAARAGIGLGFFFLFAAVLFGIFAYRRRRVARGNLVYVQQPRPGDAAFAGNQYGYGGGGPPQYPPQAHYDPTTGFAPPAASPPQYYPPPPGAPPISSQK